MKFNFYFPKHGLYFFCLLFVFSSSQTYAQSVKLSYRSNLPDNFNWNNIQTEYYKLLNGLRSNKRMLPVTPMNLILDAAAFDQANYMDSIGKLTHEQRIKLKSNPYKRVLFYKGNYNEVGENCIVFFINEPMDVKYSNKPIIVTNDSEIANALFLGWKNSPEHYKNMITRNYNSAGLGCSYNEKTHTLYCTQVFALIN